MKSKNRTRKNKKRVGGKEAIDRTPKILGALSDSQLRVLQESRRQQEEVRRQQEEVRRQQEEARRQQEELARQSDNESMMDLLNAYRGGRKKRKTRRRRRY